MNIDASLLEPFWASTVMHKESLFFIDEGDGEASSALLFPPDRVLTMTSATGEITFEEGRDYVVVGPGSPEGLRDVHRGPGSPDRHGGAAARVVRLGASRIPATKREELAELVNGGDDAFHRRQVAISYVHQPGLWRGEVPQSAGAYLPRTVERLRRGEPLAICLTGDSISEGYNASGFIGVAPHQPPYGALVASALQGAYASPIAFHNFAVAGSTADNGLYDVERVVAPEPDLVIVAYGMNDAGYAGADAFSANIKAIVSNIRRAAPAAEFVLVSPMLPNPEWDYPVLARFPAYRNALAQLRGPGVALADMTTVWSDVVGRKSWFDLSGNGLNHPNDFGHRLYAQVILAVLGASRV